MALPDRNSGTSSTKRLINPAYCSGIAQPTYWTQSSSSQTNPVGYQPPSRGQTYLTTRGPAYDSMATPLYKPNQYGARVEVGSSGSYMSVSQVGVVGTRYSPMR